MNLLDYLNLQASKDAMTKSKLKEIMRFGTTEQKKDVWESINKLGGYEALGD